jgi:hypothetical protein
MIEPVPRRPVPSRSPHSLALRENSGTWKIPSEEVEFSEDDPSAES